MDWLIYAKKKKFTRASQSNWQRGGGIICDLVKNFSSYPGKSWLNYLWKEEEQDLVLYLKANLLLQIV